MYCRKTLLKPFVKFLKQYVLIPIRISYYINIFIHETYYIMFNTMPLCKKEEEQTKLNVLLVVVVVDKKVCTRINKIRRKLVIYVRFCVRKHQKH